MLYEYVAQIVAVVIFGVVCGIAAYKFGYAAFDQFRPGNRKRALFFGLLASLAALAAYFLFRLFVELTYGSF